MNNKFLKLFGKSLGMMLKDKNFVVAISNPCMILFPQFDTTIALGHPEDLEDDNYVGVYKGDELVTDTQYFDDVCVGQEVMDSIIDDLAKNKNVLLLQI